MANRVRRPAELRRQEGSNMIRRTVLGGLMALAPVAYAPDVSANYFQYGGQYYVFNNGGWYTARGYNGPWVAVAPQYVPRPLLTVPVRYYHAPPPAWRGWRHDAPPRWQHTWGRDWHAERHDNHGDHRDRGHDDHHDHHDEHR